MFNKIKIKKKLGFTPITAETFKPTLFQGWFLFSFFHVYILFVEEKLMSLNFIRNYKGLTTEDEIEKAIGNIDYDKNACLKDFKSRVKLK